ncbi:MAG TPA: hypothetical protein VJQ50_08180 [Terriglobales bacterium]|nr:hypothetical protein [Terriglobales bacterium]
MAKRALVVLAAGIGIAMLCPCAFGQAVAESAVIHANSGLTAGVARAMGAHIEHGLSQAGGQFSYPPRGTRNTRYVRGHRSKVRGHLAGSSRLAISSVVGGPASCLAAKPVPQAKAAPSSANCAAKPPAPVANAKTNPSEITVSF